MIPAIAPPEMDELLAVLLSAIGVVVGELVLLAAEVEAAVVDV